jgi:uncharacterized SAM-binding protein YcdF (DUF218 family)
MLTRLRFWILAAVFAGLGLLVATSTLGRWLEAPAGVPASADVIVILGGGGGSRVSTGLKLYKQGMASTLLLSGAEGKVHAGYNDPIDWRADHLVKAGVPRQSILFDAQARNTWEEAVHAVDLMRVAGWHKAIVVSDPAHMRRLAWAWQRASRDTDVSFILVSTLTEKWKSDGWWREEPSRQNALNELVKLVYYYIAY